VARLGGTIGKNLDLAFVEPVENGSAGLCAAWCVSKKCSPAPGGMFEKREPPS
jgi:hypothetical protein